MSTAVNTTNPPQSQTVAAQGGGTSKVLTFTNSSYSRAMPFTIPGAQNLALGSTIGPFDIPAYGWMRKVRLKFTVAGGGTTTAAVLSADYPWNLIQNITFQDVDSDPTLTLDGYGLYLANKYGGYRRNGDPKGLSSWSAPDSYGNCTFTLDIPVEFIRRNALGVLGNMNKKATFKVTISTNTPAVLFTTQPVALPTFSVSGTLVAYSQPPTTDLLGNTLSQSPPLPNTTQFWTMSADNAVSGTYDFTISRVGNYIRNLIFVTRSAGARVNTVFPENANLMLDGVIRTALTADMVTDDMVDLFDLSVSATALENKNLDTGVYVLPYTTDFDGSPGNELRDQYIATLSSSTFELSGTYPSSTNTVQVYVNDIAPSGDMFSSFIG